MSKEIAAPTTFEAAAEEIFQANEIPAVIKNDVLSYMVELAGWEAICLVNPSTRLSGNPSRELVDLERTVRAAMNGRMIEGIYPVGREEKGQAIINPIYLLPSTNLELEARRATAVVQLQQAVVAVNDSGLEASRDAAQAHLSNLFSVTE